MLAEWSNAFVLKTNIIYNYPEFESLTHWNKKIKKGVLTQLVECNFCKVEVKSSNLLYSKKNKKINEGMLKLVAKLDLGSGAYIA